MDHASEEFDDRECQRGMDDRHHHPMNEPLSLGQDQQCGHSSETSHSLEASETALDAGTVSLLQNHQAVSDDEPLIDTTAALVLHSKRTERLRKRRQKKTAAKVHSDIDNFLDFPSEIISSILSFLPPSTIFSLLRTNRFLHDFILGNEISICSEILNRRYWVLAQCFPRPVSISCVSLHDREILQSSLWQDRMRIHKAPYYQHIPPIDPSATCSCMSCVLAWNNLSIVLDLAHWQSNLDNREPLPVIARGKNPDWNVQHLARNARLVHQAMTSILTWSRILQLHLDTTVRTILRSSRWRKKGDKTPPERKKRLYHLTDEDIRQQTDEFLERGGPPNFQPIYMRDNYYNLEAWIPNRKWEKNELRWQYYSKWPQPHENDLNWLVNRFAPFHAHIHAGQV